ncbi:MAG: type III pantothenate kinase [Candidatus Krumholzibacteria bacterium]|nr:type III pantothenate kinase [Candidatus Krumholzibacteria bacterium]
MTVLCVDVGNSHVKYGLATTRAWIRLGRHTTKEAGSKRGRWPGPFHKHSRALTSVEGVIVSSVVPSLNRTLADRLFGRTGLEAVFVDHRFDFPFKLRVPYPRRLGIDRVCAAVGAVRHGARSAIVIDVGSAVTVDLIAGREYRGGLIFAGPGLTLRALASQTEKLPRVDLTRRTALSGAGLDRTARSMILGSRLAAAGGIKEAVARVGRALAHRPRRVITGGGAQPLLGLLPKSWMFEPDLVQKGLYHVWRLNFKDSD